MKTIRIAGVPEHFNLPWHLCIENQEFAQMGINLEWINVPEGTGKMCEMLRNGTTDMAIILTEGIIKDITAGNPSKIIQTYIESPLVWGVHVAGSSSYNTIEELQNKTAAISRYGSGSHLMSYVNAKNNNWNTEALNFEIVNTLEGGVKALSNKTADYFLWEKFTTKPLVDAGIFKHITDCPTPWPCFVIAVRDEILTTEKYSIELILNCINTTTSEFKQIPSINKTLANRYKQQLEDINQWLAITQWSQRQLSATEVNHIQNQLLELQIISKKIETKRIIY